MNCFTIYFKSVYNNSPLTTSRKLILQNKEFDNEGMNIWGICETVFWNTRKELINQFSKFLPDPRDTIPVLEALIKAHGRIRSTPNTLHIKLETIEVPRYKSAQIQLMRMINKAKIQINGKRIVFDSMVI